MIGRAHEWWRRFSSDAAVVIALLSLFVSAWSSCTSAATASESNTIQAQLRDLSARVDLNLVSVKSDYVKGQKPAVINFSIELNNAGPGVASHVTFGIGSSVGDPPGRAIAVNGTLDGSIAFPYQSLAGGLNQAATPIDDPAKIVTVWVRYMDAVDRSFQVQFPPDSRYRWQQACTSKKQPTICSFFPSGLSSPH